MKLLMRSAAQLGHATNDVLHDSAQHVGTMMPGAMPLHETIHMQPYLRASLSAAISACDHRL
jgi:hypothetical protein